MAPFGKGLTRVYDRAGVYHVRTLGTSDPEEQGEVESFVRRLRKRRKWDVLDLIIARELTAIDAFDADVAGTLAQLVKEIQARVAARSVSAADPDLSPLVSEWNGRGRKVEANPKYVKQVRRFIPEGEPFPRSKFTRGAIAKFLDDLTPVRGKRKLNKATRTRYRAALLQFGAWLVQREILDANPVREVPGFGKEKRQPRFLEPHQVKALVMALREPYRALEALMAGTGMEWGACAAATKRDVNLDDRTVFAKGTKNEYRTRYVEVSEDWAWAIVKAHVASLPDSAPLFTLSETDALRTHHKAAKALDLPHTTLHNHRHAFAVMHIRRGTDKQWIKNQLGHAPNSNLLETVYGVYIAHAEMLKKRAEQKANDTPRATPKRRNFKR